jgi:hypothetical protein
MSNKYQTIERVYNELSEVDVKSPKEKMDIANQLCEKNNILLSDLVLYEQRHKDNGTNPYTKKPRPISEPGHP